MFEAVGVYVQQPGTGGLGERGGAGRGGKAASFLIFYLSCLSTESSAVPPSSLKPKYYSLCPGSHYSSPEQHHTLLYSSDHHYRSAAPMNRGMIL